MRFSPHGKTKTPPVMHPKDTRSEALLKAFGALAPKHKHGLAGSILLVGGRDHRSLVVRCAQATLRYDRKSSYWSHAAIIAKWDSKQPARSIGLEVALGPVDAKLQVPERNGVTPFELHEYLDASAFPNIALVHAQLSGLPGVKENGKSTALSAEKRIAVILEAARNPCMQRETFRLWEGLGAWARYSFTPELAQSPLLENVPHPGASFCEYAYAAAQVDLVPGASTSHTCPELIWASVWHWQNSIDAVGSTLQAHVRIGDPHGTPLDTLPMTIAV